VLVNNAGITCDATMYRMNYEQWNAVIQTNLSSCFNMSRAVIEGMRADFGPYRPASRCPTSPARLRGCDRVLPRPPEAGTDRAQGRRIVAGCSVHDPSGCP
jgi:NAD(P)-dependent dehydrogenase (short-subunit alcohol dehydrogenase family)